MSQTSGDDKISLWPREAAMMDGKKWREMQSDYGLMPSPSYLSYAATHIGCASRLEEMVLRFE